MSHYKDEDMAKIPQPISPLADVNVIPQNDGSNDKVACSMPDTNLLVGDRNSDKESKNIFMDIAVNIVRLLMMK
jgi:hypothetical protein